MVRRCHWTETWCIVGINMWVACMECSSSLLLAAPVKWCRIFILLHCPHSDAFWEALCQYILRVGFVRHVYRSLHKGLLLNNLFFPGPGCGSSGVSRGSSGGGLGSRGSKEATSDLALGSPPSQLKPPKLRRCLA